MSRRFVRFLVAALALLSVASAPAVAADKMMMGKVTGMDPSSGMATIMMTDSSKEMKMMMKDAKVGDAVECMEKDGKTECKKAMMKQ